MNKAVIYARYSSNNQTEQSIEGQVKVCGEFAQRQNLAIVGEYVDRAMTGTNDKRPEFQRMISDSKQEIFDVILVYKLDRFSRDKYESVVYKRQLKEAGVKVVSATEAIADSPEGILLESVIEGYNQFYSVELSQKIKRGNQINLDKGNWTGGIVTYGYKVVDKKIQIDKPKAEIMKKIFSDYASGKPKKEICKELNEKGIRNRSGEPWSVTNIYHNLKNKNYIGILERHGVEYTNIYPRLIDDKLFEEV
ncbi:MAG: recombinase family protein, partial [Firmicutes bacterium]|nr:recombinase family protein [Bacillota bacterium]